MDPTIYCQLFSDYDTHIMVTSVTVANQSVFLNLELEYDLSSKIIISLFCCRNLVVLNTQLSFS